MLDFASPFTYLFRDKDWLKKFLLASLLTYTVIGADPVMGWMIEITQRVGRGETGSLPDWHDWRSFWKKGAKFLAVNILWLLPMALAAIILYLPLILVNRVADEVLLLMWFGTLFCVSIFLLVYWVIYSFLLPAMQVRLAKTERIGDSANPAALWKIVRPHFAEFLLVFLLVSLSLFSVVFLLAAMTLFLLFPPLFVYFSLVAAHFSGQLLRLDN